MARPRKPIDPKKVEALAAIGCTSEEIGILLDAGARTIQRYGEPLKKGAAKLKHTIKRELIKQTMAGNTAAMIFAAKVYCGLKEHPDVAINVSATAIGGSIQFTPETKKELEDFYVAMQRRNYNRVRHPEPEKLSANGESSTLN